MTEIQREPALELGRFVAELRLDDVPPSVREHATDLLLDAIACALAGEHGEETALVASVAEATGGAGTSTVVGDRQLRAMAGAVLLNGFRITAVTACDVYSPADLHTTPEVVPPVLALAEQRNATGADALRAVIAGLETVVRIARGFDYAEFRARGWHSPGVVGPFGAAASTSAILRVNRDVAANALAVAGSTAAGTWAARGTPTVKFHQARAGLNGFLSAMLSEAGLEGSGAIFTNPEGGLYVAHAPGDAERVVADLGREWELERISLRLWPGGARVQAPMTAASLMLRDGSVTWEDIERVRVRVAPAIATAQAWAHRPTGGFAALASIPYTVAVTLRHGSAAPDRFVAGAYGDPRMMAFLDQRVVVEGDSEIPTLGASVEVTTKDGTTRSASVDTPKGHPNSRATRDELAAKVRECAPRRMALDAVEELIERVRAIEQEPNLTRILELTRV